MPRPRVQAGDAVVGLVMSLAAYADAHRQLYDSDLADDGVLGPAFLDMVRGALTLLNGELGTHDGGTLDHALRGIARSAGFEEEDL